MWPRTISPRELRELLPDLALRLETEQLKHELTRLGIRFIHRSSRRSAAFELFMYPHHIMRIEPVDRGVGQFSEWFSWHVDHQAEQRTVTSSMRCYVSIRSNRQTKTADYALTIHYDTIVDVIQCAIQNYKHYSGTEITPITSTKRNKK